MADTNYQETISLYSSENLLTWSANHLPSKTRIYPFINGKSADNYTAPASGIYGDPLITDDFGNITGSILIPYNDLDKIPAGQIRISFADNPTSIVNSVFLSEASFYTALPNDQNIDQEYFLSTREATKLRAVPESAVASSASSNSLDKDRLLIESRLELLAQSFFIDQQKYPNGVYLSAVDLFFARKDDSLPLSIEIKPCDQDGIPISNMFIPGTYVIKNPSDIIETPITNDLIDIASAGTTFEFTYPVYFKPGLYAISIRTNSDKYDLYSSRSGELLLSAANTSENSKEEMTSVTSPGYIPFVNSYGVWLKNDPNFTIKQVSNFIRVFYAPYTGNYSIAASADNSITLYIDGNKIIEKNNIADWSLSLNPQGTIDPTIISLQKGKHILSFTVSNSLENVAFATTITDTSGAIIWDTRTYASGGTNSIYNKPFEGNDVTKTGALFKPSNITNRAPIINEDLCFVLRRAKFKTGAGSFELYNNTTMDSYDFDKFNLSVKNLSLQGIHDINYQIKLKNITGQFGTFNSILTDNPYILNERKNVTNEEDILIQASITNNDVSTTPIVDLDRLLGIAYQNEVDPYETDLATSELTPNSGAASARYISKTISLLEGFDSTGIRVTLDVNRKTGTDIEVFVKVLSADDTVPMNSRPWKKLSLISNNGVRKFVGLSDTEFVQESYQLLEPNLEYTGNTIVGGTTVQSNFKNFNRYAIKVVFYSLNEPYIPKIKNLYATSII